MFADYKSDIKFDRYGDMSFLGNDIELLFNERDVVYQNVIDRLISNFADYKYNFPYGANISSFIGKNAQTSEESIVDSVINVLTYDNFLPRYAVSVISFLENDKIHLRIDINTGGSLFLFDSITINSVFNTSTGLLHVTN